ncbi:MAG: hypothetical protein U1F43_21005 [Myxococcota bacterium]
MGSAHRHGHPDEVPPAVLGDPATRRWDYRVPATAAPRALFYARVTAETDISR